MNSHVQCCMCECYMCKRICLVFYRWLLLQVRRQKVCEQYGGTMNEFGSTDRPVIFKTRVQAFIRNAARSVVLKRGRSEE
jgi:hypothetical protein